uniref:hypothetical protein n=1 Tax=Neisseria sicca TaxID=490 RepID=UPI001C98EFE9
MDTYTYQPFTTLPQQQSSLSQKIQTSSLSPTHFHIQKLPLLTKTYSHIPPSKKANKTNPTNFQHLYPYSNRQ